MSEIISLPENTILNINEELEIFKTILLKDSLNEEYIKLSFNVLKQHLIELEKGCEIYYNIIL